MDVIKFLEKQEAGKIKNMPPLGIFASKKPSRKTNYVKVSPSAFVTPVSYTHLDVYKRQPII